MSNPNDEKKQDTGVNLDRRTVISGALAIGGLSALASGTAMAQEAPISEREWARALARHVSNQLPEAVRQLPDLRLTADQLEELRKVFENTLITNMGCTRER